jgi:hypothetical protein
MTIWLHVRENLVQVELQELKSDLTKLNAIADKAVSQKLKEVV